MCRENLIIKNSSLSSHGLKPRGFSRSLLYKEEINRLNIKDNIENWISELYWLSADSYLPKIMQKIILILK